MKHITFIILSSLVTILILPIITLASITNLSALANVFNGSNQNIYLYTGPLLSSDHYAYGNCTYWVYILRAQIHQPIPNNWGNAIDWATNAERAGYLVNHNPTPGAIMQDPNAPGGLGHVAFVTQVNQRSGAWTISEMNRVGFDEVDNRVLSAQDALRYNFIHGPKS
jgi:surface antigen